MQRTTRNGYKWPSDRCLATNKHAISAYECSRKSAQVNQRQSTTCKRVVGQEDEVTALGRAELTSVLSRTSYVADTDAAQQSSPRSDELGSRDGTAGGDC